MMKKFIVLFLVLNNVFAVFSQDYYDRIAEQSATIAELKKEVQALQDSIKKITRECDMNLKKLNARILEQEKQIKQLSKVQALPQDSTSTPTSPVVSLETEFWRLIRKKSNSPSDYRMDEFIALYKKYRNQGGDYIIFLNKILKSTNTFGKFRANFLEGTVAMERVSMKTLTELDKFIE